MPVTWPTCVCTGDLTYLCLYRQTYSRESAAWRPGMHFQWLFAICHRLFSFLSPLPSSDSIWATIVWKIREKIIVAALYSRCDIIFLPWDFYLSSFYLSSFYLFLFLALSQQSQIGCLPYFYTWCDLSANLECMSEMCCTRLAGNIGHKKSPSAHHHTNLSGYIFAIKAHIDNQKKTS